LLAALLCASSPLLTAVACGGGGPAEAPAPAPPPPTAVAVAPALLPLRLARLRGVSLHFSERGSGTPVVFVHGSLGTLETWRGQIDTFATRYRVITYSRRYHPPNVTREDGHAYSAALHAADLIALIEGLQLERVHLVGNAYGAVIALRVTLERPDLVRSLVLAEPPILAWLARTPEGDALRRAFESGALQPARQAFARGDSLDGVRRFVDGVGGPGRFAGLPEATRAALRRLAFELSLELKADPAAHVPAPSCAEVGRIRNSVLLVRGQRSARMFHVITDELARCLAHEEIVEVPGAGHSPHADQRAYYNAVVLRFLERN
jgi:pimeloyl-ACP methyl ester carboxylesterase